MAFNRGFRLKRALWCIFLFVYFYHFPRNFFRDAVPERSSIPAIFFVSLFFWMVVEYYFSSPFFQSGIFPFSLSLKNLFSLYFYPYLIFLVYDFIWWGGGQIRFLYPYINIFGLLLFFFGTFLRLFTLFLLIANPLPKLARRGVFRVSRHPRYLATLVQLISLPFVFSSFIGLLLLLPGIFIIRKEAEFEDEGLREYLKKDYDKYMKNTPLLYPIGRVKGKGF